MNRTGEAAFETTIEAHLLGSGYVSVPGRGFDRERAVFPEAALGFIRETQPEAWSRLEALLGDRTGEQVLGTEAGAGFGARRNAGTLPTRRYAVVIDEAHSSQGGETATALKEVLGGEALRETAAVNPEDKFELVFDTLIERLFRAPVRGTRQGKTVLVQLRDATDPETGARYTVKRYESEKAGDGDSWRHAGVTLRPNNPELQPIVLTGADEGEVAVVAELVDLVEKGAAAPAGGMDAE